MTCAQFGQIKGVSGIMFRRLAWNSCIRLLRPSRKWFDPRGRPADPEDD